MATKNPQVDISNRNYKTVTWSGLGNGDDGKHVAVSAHADKTVQILGTLDTATPALEGSMDGVNWSALTFEGSTVIAEKGMFVVWENPKFIRPNNSGGGASTDVTYILGMSNFEG